MCYLFIDLTISGPGLGLSDLKTFHGDEISRQHAPSVCWAVVIHTELGHLSLFLCEEKQIWICPSHNTQYYALQNVCAETAEHRLISSTETEEPVLPASPLALPPTARLFEVSGWYRPPCSCPSPTSGKCHQDLNTLLTPHLSLSQNSVISCNVQLLTTENSIL